MSTKNHCYKNGWQPDAPPVGEGSVKDSLQAGSKNLWLEANGMIESANGLDAGTGSHYNKMFLGGNDILSLTTGSAILYQQASYFFAGSGDVFLNDAMIATASANLQFLLSGVTYTAGLPAPTVSPAIFESATVGKITGSVAIQLCRKRSTTQGISNPSPPSNTKTVAGKKITVTVPAASPGQDLWAFFGTEFGFGDEGPFLKIKEVAVGSGTGQIPAAGGSYDIDWKNSELFSEEPPTDHDLPFQPLLVSSLQNVMVLLGILNGNTAIQCSAIGDPESYPARYILLTTPPEKPIGFIPPTNNQLIYWTQNSLQMIGYTGDAGLPIFIRSRFPVAGCNSPFGVCVAQDDIYLAPAGGPTRIIGGNVDTSFAQPVQRFIRKLGADSTKTVTSYDQRFDAVVYFFTTGSTTIAIPYMRQFNFWGAPIDCAVTPVSAVTQNSILKLASGGKLYTWEAGAGLTMRAIGNWEEYDAVADEKTYLGVQVVFDSDVEQMTVKVYKDYDLSTVVKSQNTTPAAAGLKNTSWLEMNEAIKAVCFELTSTAINNKSHTIVAAQSAYLYEEGVRSNGRR